jgi:putative tryptophan/tyrosine transport system substrate-binding protein
MRRREFLSVLGGATAAWPMVARGQSPQLRTIGFLGSTTQETWNKPVAAFEQRLRELGWIEGRTIAIDYRWIEGRNERAVEVVAEFVRRKVDVIVTGGNAVLAAKEATRTIPIIFALAVDPVGSGFVDSLARPGANVTGLSQASPDLVGKRLQLLREALPSRRRLGIMANVAYPAAKQEAIEVQIAAGALGFEGIISEIRRPEDIAPAFDRVKGRTDVLYVVTDALMNSYTVRINTLALGARLPGIFGSRTATEGGGLMSYGPHFPDMFRRAAELVDKVLRGAKPGDLPVEQPSKFEFVVNLTAAKALDIDMPAALLTRADEVIE